MPLGYLSIKEIVDRSGKIVLPEDAVRYGWITRSEAVPAGWGGSRGEVGLGSNLYLDLGRQFLAYLFAFRPPIGNYTCQYFGVGTGILPPAVTDTALESPIQLASVGNALVKQINGVDFPAPMVARVDFTLSFDDAVGYYITEMGLFAGDQSSMLARKTNVGLNKTSDFSPTITWRIRF